MTYSEEDTLSGETKTNDLTDEMEDISTKPAARKRKIDKFAKAQKPQDDTAQDQVGRKALEQLSSNTLLKPRRYFYFWRTRELVRLLMIRSSIQHYAEFVVIDCSLAPALHV
jgi:hypothetical protein